MSAPLHVVHYAGPFGYIKPWTAVRDEATQSQQFLTPSMVEGIRQKLEVRAILRHRLSYAGLSNQQETQQSGGLSITRNRKSYSGRRGTGVIQRIVMLEPILSLAFPLADDAERAARQHICLARNEDVLFPSGTEAVTPEAFDAIPGFELEFADVATPLPEGAFLVGYNRYLDGTPMYGSLRIYGNPVRSGDAF